MRRALPMLLASAALAACGARSTLLDVLSSSAPPTGSGGAGGPSSATSSSSATSTASSSSSSATSSSASSSSGTGGAPSCPVLTQTGADLALPAVTGFQAHRPTVIALGAGPQVLVAFGLDALGAPGTMASPIADVAFAPWGAWPSALPAPHQLSAAGGSAFVVASVQDPTFTLVFAPETADPSPPVLFAPSLDPAGSAAGQDTGLRGTPLFLSATSTAHLLGVATATDAEPGLQRGVVAAQGGITASVVACAAGPITGDAVAALSLATLSTSVPIINCSPTGFAPTAAVDIRIFPLNGSLALPDDILLGVPIERLRLVQRTHGAWSLSQTRTLEGVLGGVLAEAITPKGHADKTLSPTLAAPEGVTGFAAAPLGDGFAMAWITAPDRIDLGVFDAHGAPAGAATLALPPSTNVLGPLSVITSADASALVLTWSQQTNGAPAEVHVARFGCLTAF